jgi:hypothetical protein
LPANAIPTAIGPYSNVWKLYHKIGSDIYVIAIRGTIDTKGSIAADLDRDLNTSPRPNPGVAESLPQGFGVVLACPRRTRGCRHDATSTASSKQCSTILSWVEKRFTRLRFSDFDS